MRVVCTKIREEEYMELLGRCREDGYETLSSCLRALLYSYLGKPQTSMTVDLRVNLHELVERLNRVEEKLGDIEKRLEKIEGLNKWLTGSQKSRRR